MSALLLRDRDQVEEILSLGSTMRLLATADDTGGSYEAVLVEADRGADIVPHRHPWAEIYFLLDGTMEVQVGRRLDVAGPGTFLRLPARCVHGYRITSDKARFLHLSIGTGAVDAFRELAERLPADTTEPTEADVAALLEILDRHGIELLAEVEVAR